ncbi:hypothetical protein NQZ68_015089 [Dissostichus eleginoides]|nr:hypothetical protein NQZ68_015089 [Dissostichus eleginoides]
MDGLITVSDGVYSSCSPTNVILTKSAVGVAECRALVKITSPGLFQLERQQLVCVAQWSMTLVLSKPDPAPAPSPPAENCGSIATARCCLGRQHLWEDMSTRTVLQLSENIGNPWGELTTTLNYRLELTVSLAAHQPANPPSHQPSLTPTPTPTRGIPYLHAEPSPAPPH